MSAASTLSPSKRLRPDFTDENLGDLIPVPFSFSGKLPGGTPVKRLRTSGGDTKDWLSKNPFLYTINNQLTLVLNRVEIPAAPLGSGKSHKVFKLLDGSNRVLKIINPEKAPTNRADKSNNVLLNDIEELRLSLLYHIPMPVCYVRPDLYDPDGLDRMGSKCNGGFFIMEEIQHSIGDPIQWVHKKETDWTARERNIFDLVAHILNINIKAGKEIVTDFYPRNVMARDDDSIVVVDFIAAESDVVDRSLTELLADKLNHWDGGNAAVRSYITKQLPEAYQGI